MILGERARNPKLLMVLGMLAVALANAWPRMVPIGRGLGEDWIDGIRGALFGIGIPLLLRAAWLNRSRPQDGGGQGGRRRRPN